VAKNGSRRLAAANGGTTLEMTEAGQALESFTQGMDWTHSGPLWESASGQFSSQASGEVHVFLGTNVSPNSIFNTIERPNLLQNANVTNIIYH
jgi:hypothetical protein